MQSRIARAARPGPVPRLRTIAGLCIALSLPAAVAPALAAVAYVGSSASSLGSSGASSVTMTAPSGLVSGDVMVAWVAQNTSGLPAVSAAPSGWTQVLEQDDGSSIGTAVYYRVATSSDVRGRRTTPGPSSSRPAPAASSWRSAGCPPRPPSLRAPRRRTARRALTRRPRSRRGREHDAARAVRGRLRQRDYGHPRRNDLRLRGSTGAGPTASRSARSTSR